MLKVKGKWKHSTETKATMSKAHLGLKRSPESIEKTRQAHLGSKMSKETKAKMGKSGLGRVTTSETKKKQSKSHLGHVTSKETREKLRKAQLKYFETRESTFKYKNTAPEQLVEAYLKNIRVKYLKQKPVAGFIVDFYLPASRTIIEVDGCIWHACSKCFPKPDGWLCKTIGDVFNVRMTDALKDNKWLDRGYKVIRIWEHDALKGNFKVLEIKGE